MAPSVIVLLFFGVKSDANAGNAGLIPQASRHALQNDNPMCAELVVNLSTLEERGFTS